MLAPVFVRPWSPFCLALSALCAGAPAAVGCRPASPEDVVVARAFGRPILEAEVRARLHRRLLELPEPERRPSKAALWRSALDDVLLEAQVRVAASEQHVAVLEDEVDGLLARSAPAAKRSPELRQAAHAYLLLGKVVAYQVAARVTVADDDLAAHAQAHPELLRTPASVRLRFLRLPAAAPTERLQQAVRRGKQPAEAAREAFSRPIESGDFGLVALEALPSEVRRRVERLPLHRLSEPMAFGGQEQVVFWLSDRRGPSQVPLAVGRRRVERALRRAREAEAEAAVLNELRVAARAEVLHGTMPNDV